MNDTVIILKKKGLLVPRAYLETALTHCPTVSGLVLQDIVEDQPYLDVSRDDKSLGIEKLMEIQEAAKDIPMVLALSNFTDNFDLTTDIQPFVLQQTMEDGSKEDLLAIFLEGDFPNYTKPGAGHTEEYNLMNEYLRPSLAEKFAAAESLDDFFAKLKQSHFAQALTNTMSHRGVAVFVPLFGDITAVKRNEVGAEYEWGEVSRTFDWDKQKQKEKPKASGTILAKAKGRLAALMGDTKIADIEPIKQPEPKPEEVKKPVIVDSSKAQETLKEQLTNTEGKVFVLPPPKLQGNAKNQWFRMFNGGSLPPGHNQKGVGVWVDPKLKGLAERDISTRDQARSLESEVKTLLQATSTKVGNEAIKEAHTEIEKPATEEKVVKKDTMPSDYLPTLTADDKTGASNLIMELVTRPADKVPTPLEIQKLESKWPAFTDIFGIKLEDVMRWRIADIKLLFKNYPDAAALLTVQLRKKLIEAVGIENLTTAPTVQDPKKAPQEQPTEPKKEEVVAPKPAARSRLQQLMGKSAA